MLTAPSLKGVVSANRALSSSERRSHEAHNIKYMLIICMMFKSFSMQPNIGLHIIISSRPQNDRRQREARCEAAELFYVTHGCSSLVDYTACKHSEIIRGPYVANVLRYFAGGMGYHAEQVDTMELSVSICYCSNARKCDPTES